MISYGLSPKNKINYNKSNTLIIKGTHIFKKESKIKKQNSINCNYNKKATFNNKKEKYSSNANLRRANNKILNILSNCMEKIQDEKYSEGPIVPQLAEIIEKRHKEIKKKNKKEVTFNDEVIDNCFHRNFSKKSQRTKNSSNKYKVNSTHRILNRKNSENIVSEKNKGFNRIQTISKFSKEKEKEIVFNISTSLISLYKPIKKNTIIKQDKNILKHLQQRRFSLNTTKFKKFQMNSLKPNSKEDHYRSSFSNDTQILKKLPKLKRFNTFIKPNRIKSKLKNKNKINSNNNEYLFPKKSDSLGGAIHKKNSKRINQINEKIKNSRIEKFKVLNWTNDLKNREDLTEGEYNHIQQSLRQSLIDYNNNELEEEMKKIENTETTNLVRRLPTMRKKKENSSSPKEKLTLINANLSMSEINLNNNIRIDKEKFRSLQHTGYVYDSLDDEEIEDAIEINNYYINPDSSFIYIFDSIIALLSFYILFFLPYYLAHDSFLCTTYLNIKILLFHLIDILYIIDLVISFFRSYYNYDEILIKTIYDMSCHYINNWFLVDFFAAIPFYSIFFFIDKKTLNNTYFINNYDGKKFSTHFGVKINKIHYLLFMNKFLKIFKCFSDNNRALSELVHILFRSNLFEEKCDLFFDIFILLVSTNIGTCIFIFIGRNSYPSWMNNIQIENEPFINIYICSLYYFIATITTVGYGDIYGKTIQEIIFQIILLMAGTCTYSYLITSTSNFMKKIGEKSLAFENKLKILKDIKFSNPHLSDYLYEKVLRFLRYKKNTEKNKQKMIINSLPYSLKNSLIIEMYKPIINNFIIFKGLENSNCIVQLVTAFKPIYSIKNDILIQEGDFIEEVIFVKTGILCLEIGIDVNNPKKSIVQYLKRIEEKDKIPMKESTKDLDDDCQSIDSISTFLKSGKNTIKKEKKENENTHYLKVLDIRKNEHFGETLMFLNERSFLTAKVKSKKAELFFLKKEEVIKIFNAFPNIWNRINKRSIYNMKQIKKTVRKVLLNFCSVCGINIYNEIYNNRTKRPKSILKNSRKRKSKKSIDEEEREEQTNEEEEDKEGNNNEEPLSIIRSSNSLTDEKKLFQNNQTSKNKFEKYKYQEITNDYNKSFSRSIDLDKSNNEFLSNYSKDNYSIKFSSKINSINFSQTGSNININHNLKNLNGNDVYYSPIKKRINGGYSCFKEIKKHSFSDIIFNDEKKNNSKEQESNVINIINDNNSEETVKVSLKKKVCTLIDSDSLEEKGQSNSNFKYDNFNVNDEIYKNENFNLNCDFKDDILKNKNIIKTNINNKIKIENLSKKIIEKTWIKNLDKEKANYLEKVLNKPSEKNLLNEINIDSQRKKKFQSSSSSSTIFDSIRIESFEILSSYENINEITNNKYIKDKILKNKTKEFLLKECGYKSEKNKKESRQSPELNALKKISTEKKVLARYSSKIKRFEFDDINKSEILPRRHREKSQKLITRVSTPIIKLNRRKSTGRMKNLDKKKQYLNNSQIDNFFEKKQNSLKNYSNALLPHFHRGKKMRLSMKNCNIEELNKTVGLSEEKDLSFYDKYNISNFNSNYELLEEKQTIKRRKKQEDTELEEIKHIIKKDAQNLNQPSLYYQQLFFNQIQKRKDNNQTFLPIKRNKNSNSINLDIRRTSTTRLSNNINRQFGLFLRKNILKKPPLNMPINPKKV